ncbi:MAG: hypothetical protein IPH13_16485 [Planctomycetes bacterium]|nr:hypothetical protein [Planctomycetota bacterium]MCC7168914.1 hypothetical protein [Planctomycetota bacterium]
MNRVVLVLGALLLASAFGGWLVTRDSGADDGSATTRLPSSPVETGGDAAHERGSIVVPRVTREPRVESDDHGHAGGHDHADGAPLRVLAQVHDEFGRAVVATVTVRSGGAGEPGAELARAETNADGLASMELADAPPTIRLRAQAVGYEDVEQEIRCGAGEALIDQLVILRSIDATRIVGVVVDESGRPLDPAVLGLLGPEHERDPAFLAMALGLTGVPRVVAHTTAGGRLAETLVADLDPITGAFELEVPARFSGEVAFVFAEQVLASERWREGDGPLFLTVPSARLREATGALAIEVVDETGQQVHSCAVSIAPDRFALAEDPLLQPVDLDFEDASIPYVIEAAPAVAMIVRARPTDPDSSGAVQAVRVVGGSTTRVRLVVTRAASIELWFVPERADMAMTGPSDLRCILPSGDDVPVVVDDAYSGEWIGARVHGIPPGPVAFEHDGNLLELALEPGENASRQWTIAASRAFTVRFAPTLGRAARGLDALRVEVEVRTTSDYPILRTIESPEWVDATTSEFVEWLAPGRYRIELDAGDGALLTREFEVGTGDDDLVVELP